jgi:hypothetical protein
MEVLFGKNLCGRRWKENPQGGVRFSAGYGSTEGNQLRLALILATKLHYG